MMRMTFFWGTDLGEFFFPGLEVNTATALAIASAITALFAILYEGIKVYSANARAKLAREHMAAVSCAPSESANLLVTDQATIQNSFSKRLCRLSNETSVFFFHNSIGYLVMLAVMGYNGWVFLAVIFGMGIGYFFFGHISMKINMESIQVRTTNLVCAQTCPENAVAGTSQTQAPCQSSVSEAGAQYGIKNGPEPMVSPCYVNPTMDQQRSSCSMETQNEKPRDEEDCSCRL